MNCQILQQVLASSHPSLSGCGSELLPGHGTREGDHRPGGGRSPSGCVQRLGGLPLPLLSLGCCQRGSRCPLPAWVQVPTASVGPGAWLPAQTQMQPAALCPGGGRDASLSPRSRPGAGWPSRLCRPGDLSAAHPTPPPSRALSSLTRNAAQGNFLFLWLPRAPWEESSAPSRPDSAVLSLHWRPPTGSGPWFPLGRRGTQAGRGGAAQLWRPTRRSVPASSI